MAVPCNLGRYASVMVYGVWDDEMVPCFTMELVPVFVVWFELICLLCDRLYCVPLCVYVLEL